MKKSQKKTVNARVRLLRSLIRDFPWIHIFLGLTGNLSFFIGSICFLWEKYKPAGVWLFIIGSFGMLIGSMGHAFIKWDEYLNHQNDDSTDL